MLISMSDISITVEYGAVKVTLHGVTSGANKADLRDLFEKALCAVYTADYTPSVMCIQPITLQRLSWRSQ